MKFFFLISTFLLFGQFYAQNKLQGKILDEAGVPFEYCKLTIKRDSLILATQFTDSLGRFSFTPLNADSVVLIINTPFAKKDTLISLSRASYFELKVSTEQELDGVTITVSRPTIIRQVDRVIFNPENIPVLAGGSAVDVLEFAPGVYIQGGGIMTAGGKSCRVLLNNKLIPLEGAELISFIYSIPTEDIQYIEIMEVVPLKYAANVSGGLIHIKLRTGAKSRASNGSIRNSVRQGIYTCDDFGLNYSFRKNKFSLYSNVSGSIGNYGSYTDKEIDFPEDYWKEKSQTKNHYQNYTAGLGLNYEAGKKTELGILFVSNYNLGYFRSHSAADITNGSGAMLSTNDNNSKEGYTDQLNSVSFSLTHTFDTLMKQMSLILDYGSKTRNDDVNFSTLFRENNLDSITRRQTLTNNRATFLSGGLDFTLPFKHFDISTGIRASFALNDNNLNIYNSFFSPPQLESGLSNRFKYEENIQAAYFSMIKKVKKWSFLLGARIENTQTIGTQITTGERTPFNYLQVNPQVFVMYMQKEDLVWNFTYNRSFVRPNFNELNPFVVSNSAFSYFRGNPTLKPGSWHWLRLSNTFKRLSTSIGFGYGKEIPSEVILIDTVTLVQQKTVANYLISYGPSFSLSYELIDLKRWSLSLLFLGSYNLAKSGDPGISFNKISNLNGVFIGNTTYSLDKKQTFFLQFSFYYMTPAVQNIETITIRPSYSFEVKKTFMNRRLSMSLLASDLFRIGQTKTRLNTNGVTTITNSYNDSQAVYFDLSYSFGNRNMSINQKSSGSTGESGRYKTAK
jgi:hypothetical protein